MITCMGVLIMDMFPMELGVHLGDVPLWKPICGGAPANVAVAVARLGGKSGFIGKVGRDAFGEKLRAVVAGEGVDVSGLRLDDFARTTMNFHAKPGNGTVEYCFYRNPGADTMLRPDEVHEELIAESTIFHYDALCLTNEPVRSATAHAVKVAREHGVLISFDMNYRAPLWASEQAAVEAAIIEMKTADIVKINEVEAEMLVGEPDWEKAAAFVLSLGVKLCCITLGREGSYSRMGTHAVHVHAMPVDVVDTVGCGDTFIGGVLACLDKNGKGQALDLHVDDLDRFLEFGTAASGLTATKVGVFSAMPAMAEVETAMLAWTNRKRMQD